MKKSGGKAPPYMSGGKNKKPVKKGKPMPKDMKDDKGGKGGKSAPPWMD